MHSNHVNLQFRAAFQVAHFFWRPYFNALVRTYDHDSYNDAFWASAIRQVMQQADKTYPAYPPRLREIIFRAVVLIGKELSNVRVDLVRELRYQELIWNSDGTLHQFRTFFRQNGSRVKAKRRSKFIHYLFDHWRSIPQRYRDLVTDFFGPYAFYATATLFLHQGSLQNLLPLQRRMNSFVHKAYRRNMLTLAAYYGDSRTLRANWTKLNPKQRSKYGKKLIHLLFIRVNCNFSIYVGRDNESLRYPIGLIESFLYLWRNVPAKHLTSVKIQLAKCRHVLPFFLFRDYECCVLKPVCDAFDAAPNNEVAADKYIAILEKLTDIYYNSWDREWCFRYRMIKYIG